MQFDPVVEVGVDDSGQHTMTCLGELHLEQCLKTLVERFTKCEVRTSEPLVAYREAVLPCTPPFSPAQLPPPWGDLPGLSDAVGGRVRLVSSGGGLAITVRCFPLPAEVTSLMDGDSAGAAALAEFLALRNLLVGADGTDGPAVSGSDADDEQLLSLLKTHKPLAGTFWAALTHALFTATTTDGTAPGAASEALAPVDAALLGSMADKVDKVRSSNGGATSSSSSSSGGGGSEKDDNDMYRHRLAAQLLRRLVAVGPKNCGPNLLVLAADAALEVWSGPVVTSAEADDADGADGGPRSTLLCRAPSVGSGGTSAAGVFRRVWTRLQSAVAAGFQIISGAGPLMHEPLHGVGFVVEKVCATRSIVGTAASDEELALIADRTGAGPGGGGGGAPAAAAAPDASGGSSAGAGGGLLIGQLISDVTESLRLAVLSCPVRVVEPVYACDLQCDQSQLGNLYAVLSKRRGHVHKEDIIDGTTLFLLSAHLPVAESFGFAQELLKRTSGNGTAPQLQFSHWQCLDDDPFWRPTTAEELEDHGEWAAGGDKDHHHNLARTSIDRVRKRKGLPVEEKIVVFAEKQRTLNKKK
jgi:ribosome assembly protein 1